MSLLEGLLLGLSSILFIGPVFFVILKNTLSYGKMAGLYISIGILTSDLVYILLYKFTLYNILERFLSTNYTYWVFALLLSTMGILNLFKKTTSSDTVNPFKNNVFILFSKGFLINFINPFVFLFWLGVFKYNTSKFDEFDQNIFLTGSLIGIFIIDILKVLFSYYLKTFLTSKHLSRIYKIIGILFIGFSVFIILQIP